MPANLENSAVATGLEEAGFNSNCKEGQCQRIFKLLHNYPLISHARKVMLKIPQTRLQQILQTRLQQYVTENFHMYNMDLEKAKEPEIKLPTSVGS